MINTLGLTHLALTVNDLDRSFQFYHDVFGIKDRGEFCPGEPYIFFADPDGYEVEVWFELPIDTSRG